MARPRKRCNPGVASSSYYIPRSLNYAFEQAVIQLRAEGHEIDRSDVIAGLIQRWVKKPRPIYPTWPQLP